MGVSPAAPAIHHRVCFGVFLDLDGAEEGEAAVRQFEQLTVEEIGPHGVFDRQLFGVTSKGVNVSSPIGRSSPQAVDPC